MTLPSRGQSQEFKESMPKSLTDTIQKIFMFFVGKRIYLGEEKTLQHSRNIQIGC